MLAEASAVVSCAATMIAIIMLCMGLTLTLPDFALVIKRPMPIFIGVLAQFVIMPLGAVAVAKLLGLNPMLAVGLLMLTGGFTALSFWLLETFPGLGRIG